MVKRTGSTTLALVALGFTAINMTLVSPGANAQGSPVPGSSAQGGYSGGAYSSSSGYQQAPVPGSGGAYAAPTPYSGSTGYTTAPAKAAGKGGYSKLPLSADDAKVRIAELRNQLAVSRPQDVQEGVFQLCEWLSDMADAHWKLSLALAKNDSMKAAAAQERQSAVKFSSLKHEAALLKAELFIKQNRLPEALSPLVDIVVAEPKSVIGQAAYEKLKEIGFAEEAADAYKTPESAADKAAAKAAAASASVPQLRSVTPAKAAPVAQATKPSRTAQATKTR